MKIINIRKQPEYRDLAIDYFTKNWGNKLIYEDCISNSLTTDNPLPV